MNPPKITKEGQAATGRIAEFRQNINNGATPKEARATLREIAAGPQGAKPVAPVPTVIQPTVSANDLTNPTPKVQLPQPTPPTIPERTTSTITNVLNQTRANSDNFKRMQEEQAAFGALADGQSGFDIQNEQLKRFGVTPEKLQELEDIQLQLSDRKTESNLVKTRIEGAGGQTVGQAQREVTQEDRESAVRDAGLASRAAVLQGNIETGRALANDAVNIALQDRTFQANTKIKQIEYLQGLVDEETSVALEEEKRTYEAELASIQEVKDAVADAMINNASQAEVAQLTGDTLTDEQKIQLSQEIIARNNRPVVTSGTGTIKAPDLQNFGTAADPLWKQFNPTTGAWEDVTGLGAMGASAPEETQKTIDQIKFLQSTIQDANDLVGATGPNLITKGLGNVFVGNTKVKQLQNKIDTLKTNLLTLNTDPNLRKFFGPQMTEKDTQLLMAAGSTLDAYSNSEKDNEAELKRYSDLLIRMDTAITQGQKALLPPVTQTAPDGVVYEFID